MIYSVIEIETWKRCRRKWDLTSDNRQNLESIRYASALILGSTVHESLGLVTDDPQIDLVQTFADRASAVLDKVDDVYKEEVGASISIEEAEPIYKAMGTGLAMMRAYQEFYKPLLPPHYRAVRAEQRMIVAIPGTEHWECNNCHFLWKENGYKALCPRCRAEEITRQSHFLRGTMDELIQDTRTGLLHPLERKTYGKRPRTDKLQNDTQMIAYEWMLQQLFGRENTGGTLYDGIWKRDPTTKYYRSHYKLSDMFLRHLFIHPQEQIDEFEGYLRVISREMALANTEDLYYNRRWEGCYDCGMLQLCDAMSRGEDVNYVRDAYYRQRTDANRLADPDYE